eukprot:3026-Heterococcus_DN1.PRE.3
MLTDHITASCMHFHLASTILNQKVQYAPQGNTDWGACNVKSGQSIATNHSISNHVFGLLFCTEADTGGDYAVTNCTPIGDVE